jgi:hypothetical protein
LGGRSSSSKYGSRRSRSSSSSKICACLDRSQRAQNLISLFLPFCCFLLQQKGRTNTSLHLQIEKNGRRDSQILSFASEQQEKQQKQQRQWLALHEFQVPPRRSQAAGRKGCSSFRVLAGVWLRAARRGEERTCAPGEEEEQQEQEEEQECKESFGEEAWLFLCVPSCFRLVWEGTKDLQLDRSAQRVHTERQ